MIPFHCGRAWFRVSGETGGAAIVGAGLTLESGGIWSPPTSRTEPPRTRPALMPRVTDYRPVRDSLNLEPA